MDRNREDLYCVGSIFMILQKLEVMKHAELAGIYRKFAYKWSVEI